MKYPAKFSSVFVLILLAVVNCSAGDVTSGYKTDSATGVKYLFYKHDNRGAKPVMGDIAYIRVQYKTENDSLLFDSHAGAHTDSTSVIPITLKANYHACLEEGLAMMAAGDSASFLVNADSIYYKAFRLITLPSYIRAGSYIKFYVKLVRFQTPMQLKQEQYAKIVKHREEMEKMQKAEADSIEKYLVKNKIKIKPTLVDSFYVLERTGLGGRPVNEGDSVEMKYTGMFLDGTVFDQSDKGDGGKTTYKLLYKRNDQLIRGWLEILPTMHEGEKVKFLLPSSMAYGYIGAGKNIPPYAPLIFEIEVVKVISPLDK